ncbi:hypothetical protein ACFWD7_57620 [Streptomyces mirabilis]|uniref:hypothetical protein n=1 Tax=Streptomyces mirabilis TaxID=68239 RepID=UPI0021C0F370|nr:hypothetical protein [Streptomyces mirabilis]MCT9104564.1 hypothetical protein [Streptomyces mirabilis]
MKLVKLLMACWRAAAAKCVPVALTMMLIDLVNDGFTWDSVSGELVFIPLIWGILTFATAAVGVRSLRRRAGAAGIPLSVEALDDRQTHVLRPVPVSDGWQERVREKLAASERAFLVAEKGQEEVHFRWRPGRGKQSVWGSMSFEAPSGDVVLDVRDGEGLLGVAGLGKGSSFAAVCQIAGATGLESGTARG